MPRTSPRTRPRLARALAIAALALLALGPPAARGAPRLLEARLSAVRPDLSVDEGIALRVALARAPEGGDAPAQEAQPAPGELDFDLLGEAEPPPDAPDRKAMRRRRTLLSWHQGSGFGLLALQLGATASGQLNFTDKFGGAAPANTGRYRLTHAVLSYATVAAFAASGTLAFLAPSPAKRERRWDRVMLHRVAMFTAAAGMATQAGLGIYTASREGHVNQERLAKVHLAIGYATLAAVATGVGALVL
jgi:hypothetical protein